MRYLANEVIHMDRAALTMFAYKMGHHNTILDQSESTGIVITGEGLYYNKPVQITNNMVLKIENELVYFKSSKNSKGIQHAKFLEKLTNYWKKGFKEKYGLDINFVLVDWNTAKLQEEVK